MRAMKLAIGAAVAAACSASPAGGSQLIARDATDVRLQVDRTVRRFCRIAPGGASRNVLASGAINARPSDSGRPQVEFRVDYSGGSGVGANVCVPARPPIKWLVTACRAPDGSYWAVQSWPRTAMNYGTSVAPGQGTWELRLSHWSGPLPRLEIHFGWSYSRFHQIYGRFTYRGEPVYGFSSTRLGRTSG